MSQVRPARFRLDQLVNDLQSIYDEIWDALREWTPKQKSIPVVHQSSSRFMDFWERCHIYLTRVVLRYQYPKHVPVTQLERNDPTRARRYQKFLIRLIQFSEFNGTVTIAMSWDSLLENRPIVYDAEQTRQWITQMLHEKYLSSPSCSLYPIADDSKWYRKLFGVFRIEE